MITKEHVHEALLHLNHPADLAEIALAELVPDSQGVSDREQRGQGLRRLLLDTIELLRPTGRAAPTASEYRAHECITMRYLSATPVEDIAEELALSPRQVYRDLRWGEQRLAELLNQHCRQERTRLGGDSLSQEIEALVDRPETVDLAEVLLGAIDTLSPLAASRAVALRCSGPKAGIPVTATPGILREVLIQVLSALVQSTHRTEIQIDLASDEEQASVAIPVGIPEQLARADLLQAALQIAEAQGLRHELVRHPEGNHLVFHLPKAGRRRVLVVEDNPAAVALYERFLAHSDWQPFHASHPRAAVNLAIEKRVQAIVLDIMMPETDGWRVLQALKLDQRSRSIPVVVCSVVNDPELGLALGASAYLTKPISRSALLQALNQAVQPRTPASDEPDSPE